MRFFYLITIAAFFIMMALFLGSRKYSPMGNYTNELKKEAALPRIIKLEQFPEGTSILVIRSNGDTVAYDGLNATELSKIVNVK